MRAPRPPLEYLVTASQPSLEAFELAQLNRSANLRKELGDILDEWLQTEVDARVSRWILECRRAQNDDAGSSLPAPPRERIGQLAMAFLPQANAVATRSAQIPAQASSENEKHSPGSTVSALFCQSRVLRPPLTSPMTSKDAFASLRLLEQFLAPPAKSNDTANPQSIQPNSGAPSDGNFAPENHAPLHRAGSSACPNHETTVRRRKPHGRAHVRNAFPPAARRTPHRTGRHHSRTVKRSLVAQAAWRPPPRNRRQRSLQASLALLSAPALLCHSQTRALNILSIA
jgi:hypothetical protein